MWHDIPGYEGIYQITMSGDIRSLDRVILCKNGRFKPIKGRVIPPKRKANGYLFIQLYNEGASKNFYIHRLVATTFITNPSKMSDVNHKDGNKENNKVENLEWVSHSYNLKHAYDTGLKARGEDHVQAKLSNADVQFIRENYKPFDPIFGAKPLAVRFNVGKPTISTIARGVKRRAA